MSRLLYVPLFLALLALRPGIAQDGEGETEIEVGEGEGGEDSGLSEEEKAKIRKQNAGLAGGGEPEDGDAGAPKLEKSLQERVNAAIERGVEWLKKRQDKDGSWGPVRAESVYGQPDVRGDFVRDELGPTAWAVYTLAKCGVKKSDPAIKAGLKYIDAQTEFLFDVMGGEGGERDSTKLQQPSRSNPRVLSTYETAAIVMMLEAVYEGSAKLTGKHSKRRLVSDNPLKPPVGGKIPEKTWKYLNDRVIWLTTGRKGGGAKSRTIAGTQVPQGDNKGGWRYGQGVHGDADLSATQFCLLALRAASQAGYPVEKTSPNVWTDAAAYVRNCQKPDGSFSYQRGSGPISGSMAACGIGCLIICKEQMELAGQTPPAWIDDSIKRGTDWLDQNFVVDRNPGDHHHYYYLYGIERVGDLTGRREFGGKDWYVRGAELLLTHQQGEGQWVDATSFRPHDVIGTCFALLFLKRATVPTITITGN